VAGMWKRLIFCGSRSTLKKLEAEAKIYYCFHIPGLKYSYQLKAAQPHHFITKTRYESTDL